MTDSSVDVSFIVIAHNEESNIRRCIGAIASQDSSAQTEVIVVDDGSTDSTAAAVSAAAKTSPRVHLIRLDRNHGRGFARMTGIRSAKADLIAMVDADIVIPPDWLRRTRALIEHYDAVGGIAVPDGDVAYLHDRFGLDAKVVRHPTVVAGGNGLYRRRVFELAPLDPSLTEGEDIALNHAMVAAGLRTISDPTLLVDHCENKSFGRSIKWLYQSGLGASRQFRRYGRLRVPDMAFAAQATVTVVAVAFSYRRRKMIFGLLPPILMCLVTACGHVASRFWLRQRDWSQVSKAVAVDTALLASYFVGRTVGATIGRWVEA